MQELTLPERLKQQTAAIHKSVEDRLDLLRDGFSLTDYSQLLARFYGFYAPWERAALPLLMDWNAELFVGREKVPALAADLHFLGIDASSLPLCEQLPDVSDLPRALGSAYVLEGSTLGGQFLSNHFRKTLQIPAEALHFYTVYGRETGYRWKSFQKALSEAESLGDRETFVVAARSTFEALAAWLRP
ncbi:biliverdin-producing heme oxygenase [Bryobacterales bacterium F-183]|nr:biliverdin-producing heme oxygenase [Bryobacterales bacterium F-183]